jgi:hypothetical protein
LIKSQNSILKPTYIEEPNLKIKIENKSNEKKKVRVKPGEPAESMTRDKKSG